MDAPTCRLCGAKHFSRQPCGGQSEDPPLAAVRKKLGVKAPPTPGNGPQQQRVAKLVEKPRRPFKVEPTPEKNRTAPPLEVSNDARPLPKKGVKGAERGIVREAAKATLARSEWDDAGVPSPGPPGADLPPGIVVGYDFKAAAACPECAMRRAKKAAAQQRYRDKRGKKK